MSLRSSAVDVVRRAWYGLRRRDPRLLLRRLAFLRANETAGPETMVLRPGLRLGIEPAARDGFEHFCFRSLDMIHELDSFIARREGLRHLVDVGALHGLFALAFTHARPGAQALAVEPSPLAFPVLEANLARNPQAAVRALQIAAGAAAGQVAMRLEWHHLEACSTGDAGEGVLHIPLQTLDALCLERSFAADAMKIDVEGYELEVLRGAQRLLAAGPELFLEVHPQQLERLGGTLSELLTLLADYGYLTFDTRGRQISNRRFLRQHSVTRFLCLRRDTARNLRRDALAAPG